MIGRFPLPRQFGETLRGGEIVGILKTIYIEHKDSISHSCIIIPSDVFDIFIYVLSIERNKPTLFLSQ